MSKYIIDANVPILAATPVRDIPEDQFTCALNAMKFIHSFLQDSNSKLVLDDEWRVLSEYQNIEKRNTGRSIGMEFLSWVYQNRLKDVCDLLHLEEVSENVYAEYPPTEELREFDPPDRKYIALAYKHKEHPPIIEASDSKWWGIKGALREYGLQVNFIDEEYIKMKYEQKIEK